VSGVWTPDRRLLTAGLAALVTAAAFEGMAVPTVLPEVARELDGLSLYGWAFSAFWLTNIVGITLAGSETDRSGPARPFIVGVLLFSVGIVLAGVANGMEIVILGRAVQGFGSGAIGAVVYAVIARAYPAAAKPRMIALISSAWVVPGLVGPALAGAVTDAVGWRWVFLGVVPPVLLMAAALWRPLAVMGPARQGIPTRSDARRAVDSLKLALGSSLILAAPTIGNPAVAVGLALVGGWLGLGALTHLVPHGTLRLARGRPAVVASIFVIGFAFFGTEAFVPLSVVEVRGGTVTLGGLALSGAAVTWGLASWLQARAAAGGTRRSLVTGGSTLIAVGIVITSSVLIPQVPVLVAVVGWAVAGLGMGLAYSMLSLLVLETATPGEEGFSSSALALMFTLGTALGAGIGGSIVALADAGTLDLVAAIALVNALMVAAAVGSLAIGWRVPRVRAATATEGIRNVVAPMPLEHP
jgi:MFS family permease